MSSKRSIVIILTMIVLFSPHRGHFLTDQEYTAIQNKLNEYTYLITKLRNDISSIKQGLSPSRQKTPQPSPSSTPLKASFTEEEIIEAARYSSKHSSLKDLIENKRIEINWKTSTDNSTLLHFAIWAKNINNASFLIQRGANLNAQNNKGKTPLHFAVQKGLIDIIKKLLESKADQTIKDNDGKLPVDYATDYDKEIKTFLSSHHSNLIQNLQSLLSVLKRQLSILLEKINDLMSK